MSSFFAELKCQYVKLDEPLVSILILIILISGLSVTRVASAQGQIYYVAPASSGGNDSNPGTITLPWLTIQKAADTLKPGDTVYVREGIYAEAVKINVSGSESGGFITFINYPGETPVLDGSSIPVLDVNNGMFLIYNGSFLVIEGFEIRNYKTSESYRVPVGINILGTANNIQIKNNRIHHIETNAIPVGADLQGADAHGIAVYGTDGASAIKNILIEGNELYNLKLGSSEAVVFNGNVELFTVTNNVIHDSDNIALDFIGFEGTSNDPATDQARNGTVSRNTIYNIDTLNNPSYGGVRSAGGIYVDGGTDIIVDANQVHDSNIGIEIASEHQGRATSMITVRNNILYHNHVTGLSMGGYDMDRGSTESCIVVNNTFYNNDAMESGSGEIQLQFDTRNNVIKNNIFYAANAQGLFISNPYIQNTGNVVNYNIFYAPAGMDNTRWQWKNITYTRFTDYRTGTGNDVNSLFDDPRFVNASSSDFHLLAVSPAVAKGDNTVTAGGYDFEGDPRLTNGVIDMGADQTGSYSVNLDDLDGDGVPDDWELAHGLDPSDPTDALVDSDGDGLNNREEYAAGTNPVNADTDGDGLTDKVELEHGRNPLINEAAVIMIIIGNE